MSWVVRVLQLCNDRSTISVTGSKPSQIKGLHEFWNWKIDFSNNFLYNVSRIFSQFQVNRSKIEIPSHSDPYGPLFVLNAFFSKVFFEVGGNDFSKTNAWILLKFCTLRLDKIDSWLDEGFFFLWLQLILQANTWPNFYRKS